MGPEGSLNIKISFSQEEKLDFCVEICADKISKGKSCYIPIRYVRVIEVTDFLKKSGQVLSIRELIDL